VGPSGGGGGGLSTNGSLTITGSTIVDNVADGEGGGGGGLSIVLNSGDVHVISNTIIAHNSLTTDEPEGLGGGIAAIGPLAQPHLVLTLNSDYIVENTAIAGGGIWKADVTLALNNTTVKDNNGTGQICDNDTGCD
jgi:fibronectin-binding autotransporter adhesin